MSKQTMHRRTRQGRRQEELQRRAAERRRTTRRKRITTISIIAVVALAVVGLIYFAITQNQTPANAAYPPIDKVTCQSSEQSGTHVHAHVSIYIDGTPTSLPANVGIAPDGSCLYWLHTHDSSGVIHIEAPSGTSVTFGNFLAIWEQKFQQVGYPNQLSTSTGWQVYVNGKPFTGDFHAIPLQAHTLITLAFNSPGVKPDTSYPWNGL